MQPLFIQVHPRDNVAIVVSAEGVAGGIQFEKGLVVMETIPQAHKVALQDLEKGDAVVRYGQTMGTVNRPIRAGSWVREEILDLPLAPPLDTVSLATATPKPLPALEGFTFEGYPNPDGTVGTRNILASQPRFNASRRPWIMLCGASKPRFCRGSPELTGL